MADKTMRYTDAMTRLQSIVRKVETSETDVDELAGAVREANMLIATCRQTLRNAEIEVERAMHDADDAKEGADCIED